MRTRGSEDIEYDRDDAERFRNAYRSHFSDSFHKVFYEVFFCSRAYCCLLLIN